MKKLLIVLGTLLVVAVAALAALPRLLDINRYHDRIQAELQTRLGRQVQLGQMSLVLTPPTFKVQNAIIGEDPKFNSGKAFAQTAELDIELKLQPLLHKDIQVASLRMVRPQVELVRGTDGAWNFSSLGTHTEQQPKEEQSKPLQLDHFQIDDGAVAITDLQKNQPRTEYNHIDVLLKDYAPGKPFEIVASAHLPGAGKQVVKLDGHGGPIEDATLVSTPFEGSLQLDQVSLDAAKQYMNSQALAGTNASISGNLKFKNNAGKISTNGTIRMDNVVAQGKPLGYPIQLDYNGSDDLKTDVIDIMNTQLKIGSAPFTINGTLNGKSTPALANLKVNTQNASLAELVKLGESFGLALSPGMDPSGRLSADLTARGPLSGPAVAGVLKVAQLKLKGVEANALQITLNMAPPGANFVQTLTGRIGVNLSDGKLTGVDMSQQLGAIGKFTGASKIGDGATHISQLTGNFDLRNGLASTNDLKALTDAGTIAATGTASLVNQGLDMKATAVLSKTSSQQVGGTGIGGLMTTAMANKNGEIVIPVLVTGTIPDPKVAPDVSQMAKMRMSNMLPSFSDPGQLTQGVLGKLGGGGGAGGIGGVLGSLTGQQPSAAANGQQQKPANSTQDTVNGLVGLFGKKNQKK
ncbi:MAG TPA: AsmA family protein [Candidatus Saccharimonadales bacterium]|nr:AsmA family protein [Candidatus Saccharimonadales bacterium]